MQTATQLLPAKTWWPTLAHRGPPAPQGAMAAHVATWRWQPDVKSYRCACRKKKQVRCVPHFCLTRHVARGSGQTLGIAGESLHWGLNPGPSVYKTNALPLSYRGHETKVNRDRYKLVSCEACQWRIGTRRVWVYRPNAPEGMPTPCSQDCLQMRRACPCNASTCTAWLPCRGVRAVGRRGAPPFRIKCGTL